MVRYVGMILCLLMGLISGTVYYASLAYSAAALALFLFRTLHLRVEPEVYICFTPLGICRLFKIQTDQMKTLFLESPIWFRCTGWKIMERGSFGFCLFWQVANLSLNVLFSPALLQAGSPLWCGGWHTLWCQPGAIWSRIFCTILILIPPLIGERLSYLALQCKMWL